MRFFAGASLSLRWLRMTAPQPVILSEAKDLLREQHSMIEKIKIIRNAKRAPGQRKARQTAGEMNVFISRPVRLAFAVRPAPQRGLGQRPNVPPLP